MESAYSVTRLSIAYMVAAHARTHIHTHKHTYTPQSMITHQGFRVESWSLTYRCNFCRSLGLVVNDPSVHTFSQGQDCCTQPSDHTSTKVYRYRRYFYPLLPAWIKSKLTPSHLIRVKQNPAIDKFQTYVSMGRQSHASHLGF